VEKRSGPIYKKLQNINLNNMGLGSEVRDPGVKKATDPGSRIRIGNTGILEVFLITFYEKMHLA
jgi:hypothetical protein